MGIDRLSKLAPIFIIIGLLHRELLSPQQHYDWGLRALKTVLKGCGSLLAKEKGLAQDRKGREGEIEEQ